MQGGVLTKSEPGNGGSGGGEACRAGQHGLLSPPEPRLKVPILLDERGWGGVGVGMGSLHSESGSWAPVPAPPLPFWVILGESLPPWPQVCIYYRGWH